jgi:predicted nucleic acid-binding protein
VGHQAEEGNKEVSRLVVCDTGPLIHLHEADALDLLEPVGGILIPPTVADEFARTMLNIKLPAWVQIQLLQPRINSRVQAWVNKGYADIGEAEAIGLALQMKSDWLLTDDTQARQLAESLGLEVHGSIGLLLWAVASGQIVNREQAYQILRRLKESSLWISQRVLHEAAEAIDRLISE